MNVVPRAVVRLAAIGGGLESIGERTGPFLPREVPLFGKFDGERKRICLPRLGKHRPTVVSWQMRQRCEAHRFPNKIKLAQDGRPTD